MIIDRIEQIESHLSGRLEQAFEAVGAGGAPVVLQRPPRPELGDFAVPCFPLAKVLRQPPPKIAAQIADALDPDELMAEVSSDGGFLNIRLDPGALSRITLGQVLAESEAGDPLGGFGHGHAPEPHTYLVEFSSPNTNKPLHLGHVRNNTIGLAICRMLAHAGHDVHSVSLVNDRGVHICKTMIAYQKWASDETPESQEQKGDHFVGDLYVKFDKELDREFNLWFDSDEGLARFEAWYEAFREARHKLAGKKSKKTKGQGKTPCERFASSIEDDYFNTISPLGAETRQLLRRWEAEDEEVRALWKTMNSWVFAGFDETYERMGVRFDSVDYESETYLLGRSVVEEGLDRGLFHALDDGAVVCDYENLGMKGMQNPHKILLRGDGTTVYTTQDLGTALKRYEEIGFERMIYVVGDEQKHHFQVLFSLLGLLRPELADACHHLAYGMVNLPEGKMKSREGKVVDADNLFDEMAKLAAEELRSRAQAGRAHAVEGEDEDEIARRAEVIAQGAIKFFLLSFNAASTMTFDPKRSIDFLGRTGPYCLNAFARTNQIQAKAGGRPELDPEVLRRLTSEREQSVIRALMAMPGELQRAAESLDPSKVVDATYEVARAFNQLYTDKDGHPIVDCDNPELRAARLHLTHAVGQALTTGLHLLGIDALKEM